MSVAMIAFTERKEQRLRTDLRSSSGCQDERITRTAPSTAHCTAHLPAGGVHEAFHHSDGCRLARTCTAYEREAKGGKW